MNDEASTEPNACHETLQGFRELRVWQAAMDLAELTYRITWTFPKHEMYGISSQMQRASVSVAANMAEGHTRHSLGEYLHFVSIARSSLSELETYFDLATRLSYAPDADLRALLERCAVLGRQLIALRNSLEAKRR